MAESTTESFSDMLAHARDYIKGWRCAHGKRFDVNYSTMAIRIHKSGSVQLVATAIAKCDTGCARDFNTAL